MNISKAELQKALEIVKPGLASTEFIEQATSFAFIGGCVVTYNDEISIRQSVPGLEIEGAIKAEEFYKLLTKIKKDEISLELTENEIIISSGKTKAGMAIQPKITLPVEEVGEYGKFKALPKDFTTKLKWAMSNTSSDSARSILDCVNVCPDGRIESSNGYAILKQTGEAIPIKEAILITASNCKHIVAMNPTKISKKDGGWCHFLNDENTLLSCRILEEKFPDIDRHLQAEGDSLTFPSGILEIIDRACVFAKSAMSSTETLSIAISPKKFKMTSRNDTGWFEEEANLCYQGEDKSFMVNPSLLKGILDRTLEFILAPDRIKFQGEGWEYLSMLQVQV